MIWTTPMFCIKSFKKNSNLSPKSILTTFDEENIILQSFHFLNISSNLFENFEATKFLSPNLVKNLYLLCFDEKIGFSLIWYHFGDMIGPNLLPLFQQVWIWWNSWRRIGDARNAAIKSYHGFVLVWGWEFWLDYWSSLIFRK